MHDPLLTRKQQIRQVREQPVGGNITFGDTCQFQQEKLRWPKQEHGHDERDAKAKEALSEPWHLALPADDHGGKIAGHQKKRRHAEGDERCPKRGQDWAGLEILDVPGQSIAVEQGGVIGYAEQHEECPQRVPIMLIV